MVLPMWQYWLLRFEVQLTFTYSALSRNKSLLVYEWWKLEDFAVFLEFPFQPWEISSLQQTVLAAIVGRCLLVHPLFLQHLVLLLPVCVNTRCKNAIVFTSRLKLLNRSHWIISFSSIFAEKAIWSFCLSEANVKFTCLGRSFSRFFNQAGPVSHSLLLS